MQAPATGNRAMTMPQTDDRSFDFPAIDRRTTATLLIAGAVATLAFDAFGQPVRDDLFDDAPPDCGGS